MLFPQLGKGTKVTDDLVETAKATRGRLKPQCQRSET